MKCPVCPDATLAMSERHGVEIDYCPHCRGVWLDRGELDKLLQMNATRQDDPGTRGASYSPGTQAPEHMPAHMPAQRYADPYRHADFQDSDYGKRHGGYRKRKSWLNELFD